MANAFNVNVPWLMCNGQSANNTINTCNGNDCVAFLSTYGQSGRILKDQPAMWTENEGWFTSWGEVTSPGMRALEDRHPQEIAYTIARWYARGGSHMSATPHPHRPPCLPDAPRFPRARQLTSLSPVLLCVRNYYMYHGGLSHHPHIPTATHPRIHPFSLCSILPPTPSLPQATTMAALVVIPSSSNTLME